MSTIIVTTTIQDAINQALAGDIIHVPVGTYNESITLKNGVDIHLEYGTIINYTGGDNLPTITDGGAAVNCKFRGVERWPEDIFKFFIKRTGEGSAVVISHSDSNIDIFYDRGTIECTAVQYPAIDVFDGVITLLGNNIVGQNDAVRIHAGSVYLGRDVEYGGGGCWSWSGYCIHNIGGFIKQYGNMGNLSGMPAILAEGGTTNYCGYTDIPGIPLLQLGGTVNLGAVVSAGMDPLDWCFLENTAGGHVIIKNGGNALNMCDTTMMYSNNPDAFCIATTGDQGGPINILTLEHLEGEIMTPQYCYASNPLQPGLIINGIENLLSYPEINRPEEGAILEARVVTQKTDRTVTLNWNCPASNPNFQILRDKKVIGSTNGQTFVDKVKGGKPELEYTVKNIIPTLTPSKASVTVTK